jgi:hypothetical protein
VLCICEVDDDRQPLWPLNSGTFAFSLEVAFSLDLRLTLLNFVLPELVWSVNAYYLNFTWEETQKIKQCHGSELHLFQLSVSGMLPRLTATE